MLTIGDDFDATREALTIWLRDMDDKLTAMEHNESADVQTRVNLIKVSLGHVKCIGIRAIPLKNVRGRETPPWKFYPPAPALGGVGGPPGRRVVVV